MHSLDNLLDESSQNGHEYNASNPVNKRYNFGHRVKNSLYKHLISIKNAIKQSKYAFSFSAIMMLADRISTYFGIEYKGLHEGNYAPSIFIQKLGLIPEAVSSMFLFLYGGYLLGALAHKYSRLSQNKVTSSLYLGVGLAETVVTAHNYMLDSGMHNYFSQLTYAPLIIPLALISTAPVIYNFLREEFRDKKSNDHSKSNKKN